MAKRLTPEASVQKAVMDILAAERIFAIRLNTGAFRNARGRLIFMHSGGPGVADIVAFVPVHFSDGDAEPDQAKLLTYSRVLWLECKSSTGRQTPEQKNFESRVCDDGHHYLLVRSPEDLLAWLKDNHVNR